MMSEEDIGFFLRMGYFPGYAPRVRMDYSGIDRERYKGFGREELIDLGAHIWRETVAAQFESGKRHIVPLSGGYDSRAILAALMECTEAENIETYTFGTPGTYDFDYGCRVARAAGTKHTALRLDNVAWQEEDFVEAAERFDYQTFLFHHAPVRMLGQFTDGVIWSGYIGDVVTGGHLPDRPSASIDEAKQRYLRERCIGVMDEKDYGGFISAAQVDMSFDERVRFAEMGKVTAPHVLMRGFTYQTPFINSPFFEFIMSVPDVFRRGQNLYFAMLERKWAKLFSLPSKSRLNILQRVRNKFYTLGRTHVRLVDWAAHPMTNYNDLDKLLRTDMELIGIVHDGLMGLKARGVVPPVDIDSLWFDHLARKANNAAVLKILFSLEMNLRGLEKEAALGKVVGL